MRMLWEHGPKAVSQLAELYPEPRPHINTISTVLRRLESKGFVGHNEVGGAFHYYAVPEKEEYRSKSLGDLIKNYFGGSYFGAVSALVQEEKITADEVKELLRLVENKGK